MRIRRKKFRRFISFLPLSAFGLILIFTVCLFANFFAPHDPFEIGLAAPFSPPSWAHIAGTDDLGRDLFSRILYGGRITLLIALIATTTVLIPLEAPAFQHSMLYEVVVVVETF